MNPAAALLETVRALRLRRQRAAKAALKVHPTLAPPSYAMRHAGATALVLGNGPSLCTHEAPLRALIAAHDPVVLGANHVTPFVHPDYHAFTNRKRFVQYASTIDAARSRVLLSPYLAPRLVARHYGGPYERIAYVNDNERPFDIREGIVLTGCRTVSVLLIAVAIVMGFDRILVAGLDGYATLLESERFDEEKQRAHFTDSAPDEWGRRGFADAELRTTALLDEIRAWLDANGRERFAIVTPTSYTRHYQDILPELLRGS